MANKGDRTVRVRDPARVVEWHIDKYRRSRGGSVIAVHHVGTRKWMSMKDYYDLQKAHEILPMVEKIVEGGYRVQAAMVAFNPELKVEAVGFGVTIPLPFGAVLMGAALLDLFVGIGTANAVRTAKALFKVAGPFGLILQAYESLAGTKEALQLLGFAFPEAQLTVNVTQNGNPASGVLILVEHADGRQLISGFTGADGQVQLRIQAGEEVLRVRLPDFPTVGTQLITFRGSMTLRFSVPPK